MACQGILIALKAKLKPIDAMKYETGREQGMTLTRAAFAIMVKFSQLGEVFKALEDTLEMESMTS